MPLTTYKPALSRNAFLELQRHRGKNNASYQRYLQYLARKRSGWDITKPLQKQTVGNLTIQDLIEGNFPGYMSPAQLEAQANRMAQTQQTYQQKLINQAYKEAQNEAQTRMESLQRAGRAAAAMNSELMGQVGRSYTDAAQGVSGLAGATGAAMAGATAGDVARAGRELAALGGTSPAVNVPAGQQAVETFRGGTLPAWQLGATSAAQQMGIGSLIGAQNLRATQEASAAYVTASREAQTAKINALKELAAGRPQAAMQFLAQLQNAQRQQTALMQGLVGAKQAMGTQALQNKITMEKWKIDKSQIDVAKSWAQNQITYADGTVPINPKTGRPYPPSSMLTPQDTATIKATKDANRRANIAAQIDWNQVDVNQSIAKGVIVNRRGKPIMVDGHTVNTNQLLTGLATQKGSGSSKTGGLTPNKMADVLRIAQDRAEGFYYGYYTKMKVDKDGKVIPGSGQRVPITEKPGFDPNNPDTYSMGKGWLSYQQARQRLLLLNAPPQAVAAMLDQLYQRGEKGRPIFDRAEIKAGRKRYGRRQFQKMLSTINHLMDAGSYNAADRLIDTILSGGQIPMGPYGPGEGG